MKPRKTMLLYDPAPSGLIIEEINGYIQNGLKVLVNIFNRCAIDIVEISQEHVVVCKIEFNSASLKSFLAENKVDFLKMRKNVRIDHHFIRDLSSSDMMPVLIAQAGTGVDHIDIAEAENNGVVVLNSPGKNATAVAEYIVGLVISLLRNSVYHNSQMHNGIFSKSSNTLYPQLSELTLGIVGVGSIGKALIKFAQAFGMNVIGLHKNINKKYLEDFNDYDKTDSLEYLLINSDVVSINLPKTQVTSRFISFKELALMKKGSILVNTSRGGVVVESDLKNVLENNHLRGAIVDVFESENPFESVLCGVENAILTPHISGSTYQSQKDVTIDIMLQVKEFMSI